MSKFSLLFLILFSGQIWAQDNFASFLRTYGDDYEFKIQDLSEKIKVNNNWPLVFWNNQQGSESIIEFFDYNCGFCRQSFPSLKKLIETTPNLSWGLIEYPLLSKNSVTAAAFALAAQKQGAYEKVHSFLMRNKGPVDPQKLMQTAKILALDQKKLQLSMKSPEIIGKLAQAFALARQIKVEGTPAFFIRGKILNGNIDINEIKKLIAKPKENKRK